MIIPWNVDSIVTQFSGQISFSFRFFKVEKINAKKMELVYNLSTLSAKTTILNGLDSEIPELVADIDSFLYIPAKNNYYRRLTLDSSDYQILDLYSQFYIYKDEEYHEIPDNNLINFENLKLREDIIIEQRGNEYTYKTSLGNNQNIDEKFLILNEDKISLDSNLSIYIYNEYLIYEEDAINQNSQYYILNKEKVYESFNPFNYLSFIKRINKKYYKINYKNTNLPADVYETLIAEIESSKTYWTVYK